MTNYDKAIELANQTCAAKRRANTEASRKFQESLHGTHMAPGKFR